LTKVLGNILNFSIVGEWLIKEKRAKWHSAMPPSTLRVMYGSYYRADKYYKEMELFTNKIDRAIARGVSFNYFIFSFLSLFGAMGLLLSHHSIKY